jgi:hypothetical protein
VRDVMVDGQWLLRGGQFRTLNHRQARAELDSAFAELRERRASSEQGSQ